MKLLLFFLFIPYLASTQNKSENYITYYNYCNEAEYYFHEELYDSAIYYFEKGFKHATMLYPMHHYNYSKSLWKQGARRKAKKELQKDYKYLFKKDSIWFNEMNTKDIHTILNRMNKNQKKTNNESTHHMFIHRLDSLDYQFRSPEYYEDSLNMTKEKFYKDDIQMKKLEYQDSLNQVILTDYIKKYGFPGGKNAGWNQGLASTMLHFNKKWYVENYILLISEVKKGNLEPWILARGIDVTHTIDINGEKNCPFNRLWINSTIDPFLMFQNCISIGVSPYYHFNWKTKPNKTKHFEYYKRNKKYYNTTLMYTHNTI